MQKMPLIIEGVDFSELTERLGYSVNYEDRQGNNTMLMQNGDQYLDVITRKPVLTWRLDSLTGTQLARLHAAINSAVYVSTTYYDTATNTVLTAYFHGNISAQEVGAIGPGGKYYRFRAPTLTMRAR